MRHDPPAGRAGVTPPKEPRIVPPDAYRQITFKLVPLLVVIYIFAYIDRTIVGFAQLSMSAHIGLSAAAYGFGAGVFFIAYTLLEVPCNLLLVRFGPRIWFARIMISWGLVTMAMAFTQGPTSFYILRFLLGVAEAGFYPGILFLLTKWYPVNRRARVVGLFLLANPVALAIGSPLASGLLQLDGLGTLAGWQWLFLVVGLPPVLLAFVVWKYLPDSPNQATWLSEEKEAGAKTDHNPLRALKNRKTLVLAFFNLTFPLTVYGLSLWLPSIVKGMGVSPAATGWLAAVPWAFGAVGLIVFPRLVERLGHRYLHMAVALILGGVGLFVSGFVQDIGIQMAALCVAAFGLFAGQPIFWGLPSRFLTGASAAAGLAFINSFGSIGGFVGPYGVGLITNIAGSPTAGLYFLAAFAVYGLVMLLVVRSVLEQPRREEAGQVTAPAVS
jgi:MFS family permease